jgi:hypothetical protein
MFRILINSKKFREEFLLIKDSSLFRESTKELYMAVEPI